MHFYSLEWNKKKHHSLHACTHTQTHTHTHTLARGCAHELGLPLERGHAGGCVWRALARCSLLELLLAGHRRRAELQGTPIVFLHRARID